MYFSPPKRDPATILWVFRIYWGAFEIFIFYKICKMVRDLWRSIKIARAKEQYEIVGMEGGKPVVEQYVIINGKRKVLGRMKI